MNIKPIANILQLAPAGFELDGTSNLALALRIADLRAGDVVVRSEKVYWRNENGVQTLLPCEDSLPIRGWTAADLRRNALYSYHESGDRMLDVVGFINGENLGGRYKPILDYFNEHSKPFAEMLCSLSGGRLVETGNKYFCLRRGFLWSIDGYEHE